MQLYSISRFPERDCMSFLALVAKATGKLKKGGKKNLSASKLYNFIPKSLTIRIDIFIIIIMAGIPNTDSAARSVLHDWNSGKIKFYCKPPLKRKALAGCSG